MASLNFTNFEFGIEISDLDLALINCIKKLLKAPPPVTNVLEFNGIF